MRILVVEDERGIASFLERGLTEEGHAVTLAASLREAREALALATPDLVVLDRRLPDGDGLDLVPKLRAAPATAAVPVLCLTARDRVQDRVEGLQSGADDYLVKPFAFDELLARIGALTRRLAPTPASLSVGSVRIDPESLRVYRGDQELALTAQEFRLLRYFFEHPGRILSRTRLLDAVWDSRADTSGNVVDVYVGYLRQKLEAAGAEPLLHTVRGRGWVAEART